MVETWTVILGRFQTFLSTSQDNATRDSHIGHRSITIFNSRVILDKDYRRKIDDFFSRGTIQDNRNKKIFEFFVWKIFELLEEKKTLYRLLKSYKKK